MFKFHHVLNFTICISHTLPYWPCQLDAILVLTRAVLPDCQLWCLATMEQTTIVFCNPLAQTCYDISWGHLSHAVINLELLFHLLMHCTVCHQLADDCDGREGEWGYRLLVAGLATRWDSSPHASWKMDVHSQLSTTSHTVLILSKWLCL